MKNQVHIFDLDRTFFKKNVSFSFYFYLLRRRCSLVRTLPLAVWAFCKFSLGLFNIQAFHGVIFSSVLKGWKRTDLEALADQFLTRYPKMVCPALLQILQKAQAGGHKTYLLSSSPEFLVSRIAAIFSFSTSAGTTYSVDKEDRLCEISLIITGSKKQEIANRWTQDPSPVVAYSDSIEDVKLLEWVGHPVVVRPDRALKKHALARHWTIL